MPSDGESQPKEKTKKRRHINLPDTESSDECDSPNVKTRRKQQINNQKSALKKKSNEKSGELEATCSSENVQCDKNSESQTNGKIPNDDINTKFPRIEKNIQLSQTLKTSQNSLDDKDAAASSKKGEKMEKKNSESGDQCPICWTPFTNQEVAIPSSCNHCFCLQCIITWSKNTNTCPVDRQAFNKIEVHQSFGGKATRSMPIETRRQDEENIQDNGNYGASLEELWQTDTEPDVDSSDEGSEQDIEDGMCFLLSTNSDSNSDDIFMDSQNNDDNEMQNDDDIEIGSPSSPNYNVDAYYTHGFSSDDDENDPRFSNSSGDNEEEDENSFLNCQVGEEQRNSGSSSDEEDQQRNSFFSDHDDDNEAEPRNSSSSHDEADDDDNEEERNSFSSHRDDDDEISNSSHHDNDDEISNSSHDNEEASSPYFEMDSSSNDDDFNSPSFDDNDSPPIVQDSDEQSQSPSSISSNHSDSPSNYSFSSVSNESSSSPLISPIFEQSDSSSDYSSS